MIQQGIRRTDAKQDAKPTQDSKNREIGAKQDAKPTLNLVRLFHVSVPTRNLPHLLCVCFAFLFCVSSALLPFCAHAADLYVNSATTSNQFGLNQQWQANVYLDASTDSANAVEGKLLFPSNLLAVKAVSDGNSAISLWVENPQVESDGQIGFSGIIPGGYSGQQGLLFSVIFSTKQAGSGELSWRQTRVLLNDGQGTAAPLATSSWKFSVSPEFSAPPLPEIKDTSSPEEFFPQVARANSTIFNGQWFLVFATEDKGSGMAGYQVKEISSDNPQAGKWLPAESPYLLQDQRLESYIFVKAIDQAGNERIERVRPRQIAAPQATMFGKNSIMIKSVILIGILIIGCLILILWKTKKKIR
jgi:hypothetical protein